MNEIWQNPEILHQSIEINKPELILLNGWEFSCVGCQKAIQRVLEKDADVLFPWKKKN